MYPGAPTPPGAPGYGGYGGYGGYPGASYPGAAYPGAVPTPPASSPVTPTTTDHPGGYGGHGLIISASQPNVHVAGLSPQPQHAPLITAASAPVLPTYKPAAPKKKAKAHDFHINENALDHCGWMVKEADFGHLDVTDRFRDIHADVMSPLWRKSFASV